MSDSRSGLSRATHRPPPARVSARAFTLIELFVVIAIIGILAAILIPTIGSARVSAKRAETKVRFGQWAAAMEQFKQEYGYYPQIDGGSSKVVPALFAGALMGTALNGATAGASDLCGNKKLIAFYSISENELSSDRTKLVDSFGNTDIAVIYDKNGDGQLSVADGSVVAVAAVDSGVTYTPDTTSDLNLATGVRAGVIFYSAGKGASASDIVYSWK